MIDLAFIISTLFDPPLKNCISGVLYIVCGIYFLENAYRLTVYDLTNFICQIRFLANDSHLTEFRDRIGGAEHISVTARQIKLYYAYSDP